MQIEHTPTSVPAETLDALLGGVARAAVSVAVHVRSLSGAGSATAGRFRVGAAQAGVA